MPKEQEIPFEQRYETALKVVASIEQEKTYDSGTLRAAHMEVIELVETSDLEPVEKVERRLQAAELAGKVAVEKEDELTSKEMGEAVAQCKNILDLLKVPRPAQKKPEAAKKKPPSRAGERSKGGAKKAARSAVRRARPTKTSKEQSSAAKA